MSLRFYHVLSLHVHSIKRRTMHPISTERVELDINIAFAITATMERMLARSIVLATVNKSTLQEFQHFLSATRRN